ncbi:NADH-quinone oxidoreductase subunit NuoG [Parvibium lacunae]|uniref:NADH-quinone oxidoreductase n=1 Tax=Parvibium lacunae TaxID=1888893 RepID=A0A368L4T9_9BURK|nr:NADH-quinone oxidoreductase subunit NuoG [Parvibium lacunae]RCS58170.1 NADH-quinone oxidoreductase subunit G [Parvibium lacunae]
MVELEIDGQKIEVPEGSMLMHATEKLGTYVPHFCYHKKLSIAANCRMCLVEVEKAPKPLPACATPVTQGMVVRTASAKAVQAQKGVMEFLLINHPLDCPICDQGGECQLQDLAVGYGGSSSRYAEEKRVVEPKPMGPLISAQEMSRCIQCTRCVRFGQEIAGVMELGMQGRGEHSEIMSFVGRSVDSELSGNMIDLCPVGALTSKPFRYSARTWELSRRKSVAPHDSLGSNLIVQVKNNKVLRVLPLENEAINECWLSDKDRFSYEAVNSEDRLLKPMIKQGGEWRTVEWQVALEYVANALRDVVNQYGADAVGALVSPHSTLEEIFLAHKLLASLGVKDVDARLRQADAQPLASVPWLGASIADVAQADRYLVVGSFLRKDHPLLSAKIRQATKRGAKVNVLHASNDDLLMPVANQAIVAPSAWLSTLAEIAVAVAQAKGVAAPAVFAQVQASAAAQQIAASLVSGERAVVLLGNAAAQHPQAAQLAAVAHWIAQQTGARFGYTVEAANSVGASLVAATASGPAAANTAQQILAANKKAYVLFDVEAQLDTANPAQARAALSQAQTVIAFTSFQSVASEYADVLLPITPFTETAGCFVNAEGTVQSFHGVVRPAGEARPGWKVLRVLGNILGANGFEYESAEAVREEALTAIGDVVARLSNQPAIAIEQVTLSAATSSLERLADVPVYFADALVRRAPSLQVTTDAAAPVVRMNAATAEKQSVAGATQITVVQEGQKVSLPLVIDAALADGVVRIPAAHLTTSVLGAQFGQISVERV